MPQGYGGMGPQQDMMYQRNGMMMQQHNQNQIRPMRRNLMGGNMMNQGPP